MSSELIAHEAEGRMGYLYTGYKGEKINCFSKIQLVGRDKLKLDINPFFTANTLQIWRALFAISGL